MQQKKTNIENQELPHGHFGIWLSVEFDWSERTAQNFMSVARSFKYETIADLKIAWRKEIYEELYPETKHGGDRKSDSFKSQILTFDSKDSFTKDASSKTGKSETSIKESVRRYENNISSPTVKRIINGV
jgi:hypothetical protein